MPSFGLGSLARRYAMNVMIFASWGLIYGIFCRLAIAINVNSMAALTSANSFAGATRRGVPRSSTGCSERPVLGLHFAHSGSGEADRRRRSWRVNADRSGSGHDDGSILDVDRGGS